MLKNIRQLFSLLTVQQRQNFYALQILVVVSAIMEIVSIASIIPFMTLVGDMTLLQQNTTIAKVYLYSGITSESQFVFLLGVSVLVVFFISSIVSMFTLWRLFMFANKTGTDIANRLYSHYLKQDWLFHANGSSAQLTKKISTETSRVTSLVLLPLMQMNAKIVLVLFLGVTISVYDPQVAITGLSAFAIGYFIIFRTVRARLKHNGDAISKVQEQRFRLMNEGFGGIKDVLLFGRNYDFIRRFNHAGDTFAYSQGSNQSLAQVPRYMVELVAFGFMIALVLYLIAAHKGNIGLILPVLTVYTLAGFRLLPAFQQIFACVASIKGNISAFESIRYDLSNSLQKELKTELKQNKTEGCLLNLKKDIVLENITFTYPARAESTLTNLNISIPAHNVIGIVGPSGSGKSTIIDILLGLIVPQKGQLKIDDTIINNQNLRSWQNTIGFVAQSIFLSEGSIAENVAFGIPKDKINLDQVQQALELSHLTDLVEGLEYGVQTKVGERGVQLSGGQRQRIGIARALYHKAEVLVFDEATSSLDGITEKMVMNAIHDFSGQKTIIMVAHRLKTVQKCDQIFLIQKGRVVDQGTYQELLKKNKHFKNMASHA
jgi:ABC-type multidrug transport system fused ATPase/permease subunit